MAQINWTDQATGDLIGIANFIAKDSIKYARLTIKRIRESARHLKNFPTSGRIVPETEIADVREVIIGSYRVIYKIVSVDRIDIITVHHSSMELTIEGLKKYTA